MDHARRAPSREEPQVAAAGSPCAAPEAGVGNAALAAWARLDGLQRGPTDAADERGILELLRDASPCDRAQILRQVDRNPDYHDLDELLFHDIDDPAIRLEVFGLLGETAALPQELGVISDFDDTVCPEGDRRFGSEFPGARELYAELEGEVPGDVHYVTGRPKGFAGGVKEALAARGLPAGTLEEGDLGAVIFGGLDGIEAEKIGDIERLLELHPGQRFVLLGDDGQRDPEAYAEIRRRFPDRIDAVCIRRTGRSKRPEDPDLHYVDDWHEARDRLGTRGTAPPAAEGHADELRGQAVPRPATLAP